MALRQHVTTLRLQRALQAHYADHPDARPSLADVALALAVQDGSPLTERPDLVRRAAGRLETLRPDADAEDVLLFAEGLLEASATDET